MIDSYARSRIRLGDGRSFRFVFSFAREPLRETIEENVDDGRGVEREHLAQQEATDHGYAKRAAEFGAVARAESERDAAEQRGHRGHHDGTEAQKARFEDRVAGTLAVLALRLE